MGGGHMLAYVRKARGVVAEKEGMGRAGWVQGEGVAELGASNQFPSCLGKGSRGRHGKPGCSPRHVQDPPKTVHCKWLAQASSEAQLPGGG
jgi:hypothetical protein